jgi:hypothetical protein
MSEIPPVTEIPVTDLPVTDPPVPQEFWNIWIDVNAHYEWEPVKASEVTPDMVTIDSYYPGFRMNRVTVLGPHTAHTSVHIPSLHKINDDRLEAGINSRPHTSNLVRALEDGDWPRCFPLNAITDIHCPDNPELESALRAYFIPTS